MDELKERYLKLSNEELLSIVYVESSNYTEESIKTAKSVLEERSITQPTDTILQQVQNYQTEKKKLEMENKYKGVGGWLLLFCVGLTILSPLNLLLEISKESGFTFVVIFDICLICFCIYTGFCLWTVRPNAVKLAKIYLIILFIIGILAIIGSKSSEEYGVSFRTILASIIWFSYFYKSKRVKATYGTVEVTLQKVSSEQNSSPEIIPCANCGFENENDSEFCIKCGKDLRSISESDSKTVEGLNVQPKVIEEEKQINSHKLHKSYIVIKEFLIKWKIAILIFVVLLGAILFFVSQSPSTSAIFEREKNNIVSITSSGGLLNSSVTGTGFVIDSSGKILTNYHVIRGAYKCYVKFLNNEVYNEVSILTVDAKRDIVLLKINAVNLPKSNLGNSDKTKIGDKCYVIGNPLGIERVISDGIVSNIINSEKGYKLIQITAPVSHGNSGGPVYNKKGKVIGIATSSLSEGQNVNFAVPINYAKALFTDKQQVIPLKEFTQNDASAYLYAGLEDFLDNKYYSRAIKRLYKSHEIDPTLTINCYLIGYCYTLNGQQDDAKEWLEYYVNLERNNPEEQKWVSDAQNIIREIELNKKEQDIKYREALLKYYGY